MTLRSAVRGALMLSILGFTWFAGSAIVTKTAAAPLLTGISALLLLVLLRAAVISDRRS